MKTTGTSAGSFTGVMTRWPPSSPSPAPPKKPNAHGYLARLVQRPTLIWGAGFQGPDRIFAEWLKSCDRCVAGQKVDKQAVSYTHLRAHETDSYLVCRLLL